MTRTSRGDCAQLVFELLADERVVHGRRLEMQLAQQLGELVGQHFGKHGQGLTDLHDGAWHVPHRFERAYSRRVDWFR